jgi:D-cysteine desulfhydrase
MKKGFIYSPASLFPFKGADLFLSIRAFPLEVIAMKAESVPVPYPPRVELARMHTPIQPLPRLSERLGVALYIKRDDLTGVDLSGNKVRKLEYVLAHVLSENADTVLTCGGAQSNHARATAVAAARLGLRCRLLLRTPDPLNPPEPEANVLLDRLAGAEIVWITPEEYRRRGEIFDRETALLRREGKKPYVIPEGASNALGAWGYIGAAEELAHDLARLPGKEKRETTVILATGSGGTAAGLILGKKIHDLKARIVSINVCDDQAYFMRVIGEICESAVAEFSLPLSFNREKEIEIIDGYVGRGYALSSPDELKLIMDAARTEGIFLDPVYTGKAFYGMVEELKKDRRCFGERIVFLHTGGIFGLFAKTAEFAALL